MRNRKSVCDRRISETGEKRLTYVKYVKTNKQNQISNLLLPVIYRMEKNICVGVIFGKICKPGKKTPNYFHRDMRTHLVHNNHTIMVFDTTTTMRTK